MQNRKSFKSKLLSELPDRRYASKKDFFLVWWARFTEPVQKPSVSFADLLLIHCSSSVRNFTVSIEILSVTKLHKPKQSVALWIIAIELQIEQLWQPGGHITAKKNWIIHANFGFHILNWTTPKKKRFGGIYLIGHFQIEFVWFQVKCSDCSMVWKERKH